MSPPVVGVSKLAGLGTTIRQVAHPPSHANLDKSDRAAIGLLRKVRGLTIRLKSDGEFARYLESVRAAHKPKRNFMKLLDRAKWE